MNNGLDFKDLISRYSGPMNALSREAQIERSTLYKFMDGSRVPSEAQAHRLLRALGQTPGQTAVLMERYAAACGTPETVLHAAWYRMIVELHLAPGPRAVGDDHPLPDATAFGPMNLSLTGEGDVARTLTRLLARYFANDDAGPLMLSPRMNSVLSTTLRRSFRARGCPLRSVWQRVTFSQGEITPTSLAEDIHTMNRAVPMLFLDKVQYAAAMTRLPDPTPAGLLPVFVLLPEAALFTNAAGDRGLCLADPEQVALLRAEYERSFRAAEPLLSMAGETHSYDESMQLYEKLITPPATCCTLRSQPPLSMYLDMDMALRAAGTTTPLTPEVLNAMLQYLTNWITLRPGAYFTEQGVLDFVQTGRLCDVPAAFYNPLPPEDRRELLCRLREHCADGRQTLRLLDPTAFAPPPETLLTVFRGRGAVLCRRLNAEAAACREFLMTDEPLTESLWQYLSRLGETDLVRTQQYTLDFIDSCIRML